MKFISNNLAHSAIAIVISVSVLTNYFYDGLLRVNVVPVNANSYMF